MDTEMHSVLADTYVGVL